MKDSIQNILRHLPSVNSVLEHTGLRRLIDEQGREAVLDWVRDELSRFRQTLSTDNQPLDADRQTLIETIVDRVSQRAEEADRLKLARVINATGVVLHTGLGRAPLSQAAKAGLVEVAGAGNVEVDLHTGQRRYRGHQLQDTWKRLTRAEDSLIVNNNAAATVLTLQSLSAGREVIISRGQLIEIGGSFRLPEIFELSGAVLREVGTTNRTRIEDYQRAIGPETAAIMHVHPSNYRVIGFSSTPEIGELTRLAHAHGLISIDDIGSGCLVDVTRFGLPPEPTFTESLAEKADVVLGSGDKLLGGPQCGIILGKHEYVQRIRKHPFARAVRVDKLTLGALSSTLDSYLRGKAEEEIPTLILLSASVDSLLQRAHAVRQQLNDLENLHIEVKRDTAQVGGGSLPGAEFPTAVLALSHNHLSADQLAQKLRLGSIRLFGRIQHDRFLIDFRSVLPEDDSKIALALRLLAEHEKENSPQPEKSKQW